MTKPEKTTDNTEEVHTKDHLWKPGQSGNPNGRPKGSKNLSTMLWEALQEKARNSNGEPMKETYADLFIKRVLKDAIEKGNGKELIFDRIEGKAAQPVDVTSGGETLGSTSVDVMELARKVSDELKTKKTGM